VTARTGGLWVTYKGLRAGRLKLAGNVVIASTSVAPAYSLAATLAAIVAVAGPKTPALFIIGFIPMMLTALAFRELAKDAPDCGSTFTWTTRAFGPWAGWMAGWALVIAYTVSVGNGAQIAAIYLLRAVHQDELARSTAVQMVVGGLAIVLLVVLCIRGIHATHRSQAVLLTVEFAALLLVSVVALVKVFTHHAGAQAVMPQWSWLSPTGLSFSAIAHGSILCVFAYWGWDAALTVSEETKHPHRTPGRAAVLATLLIVGTYVVVSLAIQSFAGFGKSGFGLNNPANANDTLSVLGAPVVGGLAVVLLVAIGSSSLGSVLTSLAPTARIVLAMAVYRALPRRFALVHRIYQTPALGTVVIGASGFAIYAVMTLFSRNSLPDMVSSLGLVTAFYYAATAYACVWTYLRTLWRGAPKSVQAEARLKRFGLRTRPTRDFFLRGVLPLVGALVMTWAFLQSAVDMYSPHYGNNHLGPVGNVFIMGIGLLVLGIPVAALCAIGQRGFFSGKTLDAAMAITVGDDAASLADGDDADQRGSLRPPLRAYRPARPDAPGAPAQARGSQ
jgi:amino acid transporter